MAYNANPSPLFRRARRRVQFSLRAVLTFITAAFVWLGYHADQMHRQKTATSTIRVLGGDAGREVACDLHGATFRLKDLLARWFGWDAVYTVNVVHLGGCRFSNDDLPCLAGLPYLETAVLTNTPIGDDGLVHLSRLKHLKFLDLRFTRVTPEGVERLRRDLPKAKIVYRSDLD